MDYRTLEVTLVSAEGLKKHSRRMRTYAVAWVYPDQRRTTRTDDKGGRNPTWNETLTLAVPSYLFQQPQTACLNVQIYSRRTFLSDKLLGWVQIPLSASIGQNDNTQPKESSYTVLRRHGKAKGSLRLKLLVTGGPIPSAPPPVSAYPPPPPASVDPGKGQPALAYPPPYYNYNNNYAGVPPGAYTYPPQPAPYPYYGAPVVAPPPQPPRRGSGGMGLGTGLLAGALGGLILGEVVDDVIF